MEFVQDKSFYMRKRIIGELIELSKTDSKYITRYKLATKMGVQEGIIKYHLNKLIEDKVIKVKKTDTKSFYFVDYEYIRFNGSIIFKVGDNTLMTLDCKYFDECNKEFCFTEGCRLYESLPKGMKKAIDDVLRK